MWVASPPTSIWWAVTNLYQLLNEWQHSRHCPLSSVLLLLQSDFLLCLVGVLAEEWQKWWLINKGKSKWLELWNIRAKLYCAGLFQIGSLSYEIRMNKVLCESWIILWTLLSDGIIIQVANRCFSHFHLSRVAKRFVGHQSVCIDYVFQASSKVVRVR